MPFFAMDCCDVDAAVGCDLVRFAFICTSRCAALGSDLAAFDDRVRNTRREKANGTQSVVVARDDEIDALGRAVRVNDRDDRDAEAICLFDGDIFFADVDDEHHVRHAVHVLDAGKVLHQAFMLAVEFETLFLGEHLEAAVLAHRFDVFELVDRFLDCLDSWSSRPPSQRLLT